MNQYLPTIGLEIHAELKTKTKMFCASKNDASEKRPNINVCPVCMAHPGTLPVINAEAVRQVLRVGMALGSRLADYTEFDRKNYFYPDLPKGYQLSQFEYPLVAGGALSGIQITRIHLEEDTASSTHDEHGGATLVDYNRAGVPLMELVTEPVIHTAEDAGNFGRELQLLLRYLDASDADMEKGQMRLEANVSVAKVENAEGGIPNVKGGIENNESGNEEQDTTNDNQIHSKDSNSNIQTDSSVVSAASSKLQAASSDVSATSYNLQAGNLPAGRQGSSLEARSSKLEASATVSSEKIDLSNLGTKVEIKNINSFRAMERAVQYEIKRQIALLEKGGTVIQETRGWDENKQATFSQRVKEGSADYRYFPDPDLPSLKLSEIPELAQETLRASLPELPWQRRTRYQALGINTQDADLYVKDGQFGRFFEEVAAELGGSAELLKLASNYIANDLVKILKDVRDTRDADGRGTEIEADITISARSVAKIVHMIADKKISSRSAKELLALCMDGTTDPEKAAADMNLMQTTGGDALEAAVTKLLADNASVAADFKAGKATALEYLVGQGMKAMRGAADASALRDLIRSRLS